MNDLSDGFGNCPHRFFKEIYRHQFATCSQKEKSDEFCGEHSHIIRAVD
jgi:hypothetical protein